MQNKLFLIVILLGIYSCNKEPDIEFLVVNNQGISMDNIIEFMFINKSDDNLFLFINNKGIVNPNENYSIYYKLYDESFKELENGTNSILDGDFLLSGEYDNIRKAQQDSIKTYKATRLNALDTIKLSLDLKNKCYIATPLDFKEYTLQKSNKYYISFFYQGYNNELKTNKNVLQSQLYLLNID